MIPRGCAFQLIGYLCLPSMGPPLPVTCMCKAPYPTIYSIDHQDFASLSIHYVSRVNKLNAQKMAKLGWDGL